MKDIKYEKIINSNRYINEKLMTDEKLQEALNEALKQIDKLWDDMDGLFPTEASKGNVYQQMENDGGWGTGFWCGMLWHAYEMTGDEKYRQRAEQLIPSFCKRIEEKIGVNHHDMGFLYVPACVAAYKLTGNEDAKKAALMAADHLLTRFRDEAGYIQAWGDVGTQLRLIIDCMNNIPLLYWAAEVTGDKSYYEKAYSHARVTIEHIVREDASTFHTFYFDADGNPLCGRTAQGASDDSAWARGQAWIVSGLPISYRYTKDEDMKALLPKVTNYFINRLPEDFVPFWDLSFTDGDDEERDSSAAAIAACGILDMLAYIDDAELRKIYEGVVDKMMYSLYEKYSSKVAPETNGVLVHAVYSRPANIGVDECNIWGCYYYMEALARMIKGTKGYW